METGILEARTHTTHHTQHTSHLMPGLYDTAGQQGAELDAQRQARFFLAYSYFCGCGLVRERPRSIEIYSFAPATDQEQIQKKYSFN